MSKFCRVLALLLAVCLMAALFAGCGSKSSGKETAAPAAEESKAEEESKPEEKVETKFITLASSPSASSMYPYWVAVAQAIQQIYPEYNITVSESQGATDICKRIKNGEAQFGNGVSTSDYENYTGTGAFEGIGNPKARLLWGYNYTLYNFFVSQESGVQTWTDLDGKRINDGGTGLTISAMTRDFCQRFGVSPDYLESGKSDAGDAYANRQIIGMATSGGSSDPFIVQENASLPLRLLSFTDEQLQELLEAYPYFSEAKVAAGTYTGVDEEVTTVKFLATSQSSSDLPQEDGYKFCKAIDSPEGRAVWETSMADVAKYDFVEACLNSPIPLHAGTVQYLVEKGVEVPENLIPPEYVPVG